MRPHLLAAAVLLACATLCQALPFDTFTATPDVTDTGVEEAPTLDMAAVLAAANNASAKIEQSILEWLRRGSALTGRQAESIQGIWLRDVVATGGETFIQGNSADVFLANQSASYDGTLLPPPTAGLSAMGIVIVTVDKKTGLFYGYRVRGERLPEFDQEAYDIHPVTRIVGTARPYVLSRGKAAKILRLQYVEDADTQTGEALIFPDEQGQLMMRVEVLEGLEVSDSDGQILDNQAATVWNLRKNNETLPSVLPAIQAALPLRAVVVR